MKDKIKNIAEKLEHQIRMHELDLNDRMFLRFNLYFCHVILEFCLFSFCNTKISEKSDMAKS